MDHTVNPERVLKSQAVVALARDIQPPIRIKPGTVDAVCIVQSIRVHLNALERNVHRCLDAEQLHLLKCQLICQLFLVDGLLQGFHDALSRGSRFCGQHNVNQGSTRWLHRDTKSAIAVEVQDQALDLLSLHSPIHGRTHHDCRFSQQGGHQQTPVVGDSPVPSLGLVHRQDQSKYQVFDAGVLGPGDLCCGQLNLGCGRFEIKDQLEHSTQFNLQLVVGIQPGLRTFYGRIDHRHVGHAAVQCQGQNIGLAQRQLLSQIFANLGLDVLKFLTCLQQQTYLVLAILIQHVDLGDAIGHARRHHDCADQVAVGFGLEYGRCICHRTNPCVAGAGDFVHQVFVV